MLTINLYEASILIIFTAFSYLYWNFKKKLAFFDKHGMPYAKPNFIFGNFADSFLAGKPAWKVYDELYQKLEPHKFAVAFLLQKPAYMVRDINLIKTIMTKDFAHFQNRTSFMNPEIEPLTRTLFGMKGDEWRSLRMVLSKNFTPNKLRTMMFPLVKKCSELQKTILNEITDTTETFDIRNLAQRYITDVIGTCAFGLEINSLKNLCSEFIVAGKKVFTPRLATILYVLWPTMPEYLRTLFNLKMIDDKVNNFFMEVVITTVKSREDNNITRNDILDMMIALKNGSALKRFQEFEKDDEEVKKFKSQIGDKQMTCDVEMTNELMAALCFMFFIAGFESVSTAITFSLIELARNDEIQKKIRAEIKSVLKNHNNELTFESLKEMTYMDMVIAEILRKYPTAGILMRQCNQTYKIPDTEVIIPEDAVVVFPIYAIHKDKKYYERPEEFYPEHFTEEAKAKRPNFAYIPFGEGPRVCIAERFAKMTLKTALVNMLENFSYQLSKKTKFPLEFKNIFGIISLKKEIWLESRRC